MGNFQFIFTLFISIQCKTLKLYDEQKCVEANVRGVFYQSILEHFSNTLRKEDIYQIYYKYHNSVS